MKKKLFCMCFFICIFVGYGDELDYKISGFSGYKLGERLDTELRKQARSRGLRGKRVINNHNLDKQISSKLIEQEIRKKRLAKLYSKNKIYVF